MSGRHTYYHWGQAMHAFDLMHILDLFSFAIFMNANDPINSALTVTIIMPSLKRSAVH